jgi:rhamnose utilization protein RhaD (predicted bifunctional aldolase and dehydrogenase)/NAD(P)-dependent dehydrogenase (short-subunit alcohol dehydrogenase family)
MDSLYLDAEAEAASSGRAESVSHDLALRTYTARLLGKNQGLVLHGGGNTSVKSRATTLLGEEVDVLCVKGSGWDLATIEPEGHPACVLSALLALSKLPTLSDEAMVNGLRLALLDAQAPTPSVEALLHAVLPAKFVDHTHADAVLALVDQPNAEELCRECFPTGLVWVPYVMPGFSLAHACEKAWDATVENGETPEVMLLDKHGIFTFGDTAKESYERMIACVTRAERYAADRASTHSIGLPVPAKEGVADGFLPVLRGTLATSALGTPEETGPVLSLRTSDTILAFLERKDLRELVKLGSATPDHVIRTKPWPLVLDAASAAEDRSALTANLSDYRLAYDAYFAKMCAAKGVSLKKLDSSPKVVLVPGLGIVTQGATSAEAEAAADIYEHTVEVMSTASEIGTYTPVSAEDLFDVEYWSLEQKKLGKAPPRRAMTGKIALVTGAASGIGRATAREILAEGGHVALVDRDAKTLAEVKAELERAFPMRVLSQVCNVGHEEDVAAAFRATVSRFGGLDVLVSNAGTAPEGALDTEEGLATLSRSLEENLLSHARVAKHATRIFTAQGRGGCLLFNASKSAFAPGPGFGPYAVAKSALVALMRQLAIDLAPRGIRSNAINADRIRTALFGGGVLESRAKARGLTPDEYFRSNLLKREVTAKDVAEAFVHLARALSTTGTVLTVDGGNAAAFPR